MLRNNDPAQPRSAPSGAMMILIAALLWSTTGVAAELLPDVPVYTIGALRLIVGAVVLAFVAFIPSQRTGDWTRLDRLGRGLVILAGLCAATFQIAFFGAVRLTGAALGPLVVLASAPIWAALVEWLVKHERPSARWYTGTAIAIAGAALLSTAGHEISVQIGGLACGIVSGACYAGYSNTTRMLGQRGANRLWIVRTSVTVGAVLCCPLLLFTDFGPLANARAVLIITWLAVPGTALAYLAFVAGLRYATARTAASLGLAQPLVGALLAVAILDEPMTPPLAASAILLIGGLAVISVPGRAASPPVLQATEAQRVR